LLRVGGGENREGRRLGPRVWRAAGVAHDGGEFIEQGGKAVRGRTVLEGENEPKS